MVMLEQDHHSPMPETTTMASDDPQLPGLDPVSGGSVATMATGDTACGGGAGEERGAEGTPLGALMSVVGGLKPCSSHNFASPHFERKPRSHVPRAAPSSPWGSELETILPPTPAKKKARKKTTTAKKRDRPCAICGATETPLWRTWPTDQRVTLCNACGIRVREPGAVLPELVYLTSPATATTAVVSELEPPAATLHEIQPVSNSARAPLPKQVHVHLSPPATATITVDCAPQEIQDSESSPDSPILESMLHIDVYLLKRTSPRREKSPPPLPAPPSRREKSPPPLPAPPSTTATTTAAEPAPAPGNEKDTPEKYCQHCGTTSTPQWRTGPAGEGTLCNACGVYYRKRCLVPEYRPRASPTFNQSEHSYKHDDVLKIREKQDHPAPPAAYKCIRPRRKRCKGKGQQQPAQVHKKKGNKAQNQPAQAQPAAVAAFQVRKKISKGTKQHRQPPQPAATQPRAGNNDMLQNLPPPPPELPLAAEDMDTMAQRLPPPPAQPHAGGEQMMDEEPLAPPDTFLFDGPAAPMIIDDDEPVVIVIDDD